MTFLITYETYAIFLLSLLFSHSMKKPILKMTPFKLKAKKNNLPGIFCKLNYMKKNPTICSTHTNNTNLFWTFVKIFHNIFKA